MKWFKHDSRARNDAKLAKVIMRHGIEGYGLYFACLEIIAEELTPENFNFELEHDAELLANMFRMDTLKVEKIMRDFIELNLFEMSHASGRVACYKLAKRLDNATAQNTEVRKILSNFKELKVSEIRGEEIRLEEKRGKEEETPQQQKARDAFEKYELFIRSNFPHTDFEVEREKFIAYSRGKNLGADPYVKILAWFQRIPKPVKEEKPSNMDPHHEAAIRARLSEYYREAQ